MKPSRLVVVSQIPARTVVKTTDKGIKSDANKYKESFVRSIMIEEAEEDEEEESEEEKMRRLKELEKDPAYRQKIIEKEAQNLSKSKEFKAQSAKISEIMGDVKKNVLFENDIAQSCSEIILNSRIRTMNSFIHKFNTAIIGPRKSGKSIFLKYLCKEVILTLAVNKENEKKLILFCDFSEPEKYNGVLGLYTYVINLVFNELEKRVPFLADLKQKFVSHFLSLPGKDKQPLFPKAIRDDPAIVDIVDQLNELTYDIIKVMQDPAGLEKWLALVAAVPSRIASAFGFNIIWFIDHFDCVDITVPPQVPFNESLYSVFLVEYVKTMINYSEYIIASQDDERFFNVLQSNVQYGIDMTLKCRFFNIADIEIKDKYRNTQIKGILVEFSGDYQPVKVTINHCANCPGYLAVWNYLASKLKSEITNNEATQATLADIINPLLRLIFEEKTLPPTPIKFIKALK